MDVVDAYGATIERLATEHKQIYSASELPYEKPLIEAALLTLAQLGNTSAPETTLKAGYAELAAFQSDGSQTAIDRDQTVPSTREEIAAWMSTNGPKMSEIGDEARYMAMEMTRRRTEWDVKLNAMRDASHA